MDERFFRKVYRPHSLYGISKSCHSIRVPQDGPFFVYKKNCDRFAGRYFFVTSPIIKRCKWAFLHRLILISCVRGSFNDTIPVKAVPCPKCRRQRCVNLNSYIYLTARLNDRNIRFVYSIIDSQSLIHIALISRRNLIDRNDSIVP